MHHLINFWQIIFIYNKWSDKICKLVSSFDCLFARYMFEGGTNFGYMNGEFESIHSVVANSSFGGLSWSGLLKSDLCLRVKKYLYFFFYKLQDSFENGRGRWWHRDTLIIYPLLYSLFICQHFVFIIFIVLFRQVLTQHTRLSSQVTIMTRHSRKPATSRTSTWPFDRWCPRLLTFSFI